MFVEGTKWMTEVAKGQEENQRGWYLQARRELKKAGVWSGRHGAE